MEYDNDYKSKYTSPADQNYTRLKKDEKNVKNDMDANSPRGDGEQDRKSLLEEIFYDYQQKLQYQKTETNPLVPYME